jgi:shikimate dehydrogenase
MIVYGLFGYPLSHSGSVAFFTRKFRNENLYDRDYRLFPFDKPDKIRSLINEHRGISGLNVTIPYKESIIPFLDEIDPFAKAIGAVNTIKITRMSSRIILTGYNTDAEGFIESADFSDYSNALILGTGGAAKAVAYGLEKLGKRVLFVSRKGTNPGVIPYSAVNGSLLKEYLLVINATPCGMFPDNDSFPAIPYKYLSQKHYLYDLVYNPGTTRFLQKGAEYGCSIQNGEKMLETQAALSYRIWAGI